MWHQWFNIHFMELWEYFFFSSLSRLSRYALMKVPRLMHVDLLKQEPAFWRGTQIRCALFTSRGRCKRLKILTERMICNILPSLYWFKPKYTDNELREMDFLRQNGSSCFNRSTCMCRDTLVNARRRLTGKRRNCWIKSLFLFSLHTKRLLVAS